MNTHAPRRRFKVRAVRIAFPLLLATLLVACGTSGGGGDGGGGGGGGGEGSGPLPPPPEPTYTSPGRYIDVTGDRSIVMTEARDEATIEAVVRDAETDEIVDGALITFTSSNEGRVTVDAAGVVTASSSVVSSTQIVLSAEDAFDEIVTASIVDLTAATTYVPSASVLAYDPEAGSLTLTLDVTTAGLGEGEVVLSGERGGVLATIVDETARDATSITFQVEDAGLLDAVAAMDAFIEGPAVRGVARVEESGVTIYATDGTPLATTAVGGFSCETERGDGVSVDIDGSYLDYDVSFRPVVRLNVSGLSVQVFELSVVGTASIDARSGTLTLRSDLNAQVTCERALSTFPLAFVPVFGPLGFAPTVTPAFGFEASADANVGSIAVTGPSVDVGVDATAGVRYLAGLGFGAVSDFTRTGDGIEWGAYEGDVAAAFEAKVEPFLKLTFAASANLGPRSIANFGIAEVKAGGGAEIELKAPLDPLNHAYTGPVWAFKATGSGGLGPLLENVQAGIGPVLEFLGIDAGLDGLDAELFTFETTLDESPKPQAEGTISTTARYEMSLVAADAASSGTTEFVGWIAPTGNGSVVATGPTVSGRAHARWYPLGAQRSITEIKARSYAAPFGSLGLPYAGGASWVFAQNVPNRAFVEVPERDGLDAGDAVENWIGFSEDTIPSDVGELVVEWNDGAADQRMSITRIDPPENGVVFNAEIDTTFDTDGLHYQTIRVTLPDGTFVDDRSVPVLVGGRFERVADIEYLGVGVHFVTNHEGASQDFTISVYGQDPDLYVVRGETYLIENATNPAVDFSVKVADVSSDYFLVDAVDYDTFRNGATADRIRFTIPMDAPNVLYYRSDLAPEMGGVLYVLDE